MTEAAPLRIGVLSRQMFDPLTRLQALASEARQAEALGLASFWLPHVFNFDALGALVHVASATRRLELGTSVVPAPSRHPIALAQQALTVQAASDGRLALGIGLSHRVVVEGMWGLSYDKPARQMREYLEVLNPLLRCERASFEGEFQRVQTRIEVADVLPPPVILAAMGPRMLALAGRCADGAIPWLCGPKTLEGYLAPTLRRAAAEAGRPQPRLVVALPVAWSERPDEAREVVSRLFAIYKQIPSYAGMLAREGVEDPAQVALVGDESVLRGGLARLRDGGASDFAAVCVPLGPDGARHTLELLGRIARGE